MEGCDSQIREFQPNQAKIAEKAKIEGSPLSLSGISRSANSYSEFLVYMSYRNTLSVDWVRCVGGGARFTNLRI